MNRKNAEYNPQYYIMKKYLFTVFVFLSATSLFAQMTVEEINHRLDTRPYFELGFEYDETCPILPDSIKVKMINALDRVLPEPYADSVFTLSKSILKNIEKYAWEQCKKDTACFEKTYGEALSPSEGHSPGREASSPPEGLSPSFNRHASDIKNLPFKV
jgi:hypothetical protein